MTEPLNPLEVLLSERVEIASSVPSELVESIYEIEQKVQFDVERREAPTRIRQIVQARLDQESLTGDSHDDATQ